jgi:uncharacterized protein (DUF1800 family)
MIADTWAPYSPDEKAPWNLRRVVHLHRRAGFAAIWAEVQRDLKDGPRVSIDRVLGGTAATTVPPDFAATADLLGDSAVAAFDPTRLKAWWVYRMLFGPDPLAERLASTWHGHFATSNLKVNDLRAMRRQNELFRAHGCGKFADLLNPVVRDPAMLVWLDAQVNRQGHPNENLARELMELFTLGISHYTETDVKEAARALTGWTVENGRFAFAADRHDDGEKTIFGKSGNWIGDDLVRFTLEHPATAGRLAWRLCDAFLGEQVADTAALKELADGLREHELDVRWGVETVLRSRLFFSNANLGTRVLSPVEFVLGAARALDLFDPPPSTLVLAEWCGRLGQDLFYPPNVGGWPGGRAWLTTRSVIGRANYAAALVEGSRVGRPAPFDALGFATKHGQGRDPIGLFTRLLLGVEPTDDWRARITAALGADTPKPEDHARKAVAVILSTPEAQLG